MAQIKAYKNGELLVSYNPSCEYTRRHITPKLIAEIDRTQSKTFIDDPAKEEIYKYLAREIADRCFPVMSRDEIARLIAQWEIFSSQEECEAYTGMDDGCELADGRWIA